MCDTTCTTLCYVCDDLSVKYTHTNTHKRAHAEKRNSNGTRLVSGVIPKNCFSFFVDFFVLVARCADMKQINRWHWRSRTSRDIALKMTTTNKFTTHTHALARSFESVNVCARARSQWHAASIDTEREKCVWDTQDTIVMWFHSEFALTQDISWEVAERWLWSNTNTHTTIGPS